MRSGKLTLSHVTATPPAARERARHQSYACQSVGRYQYGSISINTAQYETCKITEVELMNQPKSEPKVHRSLA